MGYANFEGRKWKNLSNPHKIAEKRQRKSPYLRERGEIYCRIISDEMDNALLDVRMVSGRNGRC